MEPPEIDRWDCAAFLTVLLCLVVAYVIYPEQIVQYGAWLVIFTIWMGWFFYFGTKWLYSVDM
jgi:hypothetical protein